VRPDADTDPCDELRFAEAEPLLLRLLADDIQDGRGLASTLLAFAGDRPLCVVRLRPHEAGEVVSALLEILALLLPLGADRIVLALPGRVWSAEDPIAPVTDEVDLRQPVVVHVDADAHGGPCRVRVRLRPFDVDERGRCWWQEEVDPEGPLDAPLVAALQVLLDRRHDLEGTDRSGAQVAAQFGRVLLLGHEVLLAPPTVEALIAASSAAR
jgi:hypothetical protein